jgi:hypothetical protein
MPIHHDDFPTVEHVARYAVLAMCCRGVFEVEKDASPEVARLVITVEHDPEGLPLVDLEYRSASGFPVGGVSL